MSISRVLLGLLEQVEWPAEVAVDYLRDYYRAEVEKNDGDFLGVNISGSHAIRELIQPLVHQAVKSRLEPRLPSIDQVGETVEVKPPLQWLDDYFTVTLLVNVPGIVKRWRRLEDIRVALRPLNDNVSHYMLQATTCYLYGLYEAASVLCRTVLEFTLREQLGTIGGVHLREQNLNGLITLAEQTRLLRGIDAQKARQIQRVGNRAIHSAGIVQREALAQVQRTVEVLRQLYGEKAGGER
jgi:hypothetical protein